MPIGSGAPPGYYDYNGKRYREGNNYPLTPAEVDASEGHGPPLPDPGKGAVRGALDFAGGYDGRAPLDNATPELVAQRNAARDAANAKNDLDNHYNYGGRPGGAAEDANRYRGLAEAAQKRQGEQIDYYHARNYGTQAQQNGARQLGMAGLMEQRARGEVPSIAQMQADRQMRQAAAEQSSAAAGARGPAGLALAQQGAAANTAAMQSNISGQAQINGAQERLAAEQAAFGAYSGMRGQDFQGMGIEAGMAQKQSEINAQQRAQNDQYSQAQYGNEIGVNRSQLDAQGNQIAAQYGMANAQAQRDQAGRMHSDDRFDKYLGAGLGAAGAAGAVALGAVLGGGGGGKPQNPGGNVGGGGAPEPPPGYGADAYGEQGYHGSMEGYDPNSGSDVRMKQGVAPLNMGGVAARADMGSSLEHGFKPFEYEYKPGYAAQERQAPGEKNVGPMAQNMASNPVTGSAVKQGPDGMLMVDIPKATKVNSAGIGYLAAKQRQLEEEIARLKGGR